MRKSWVGRLLNLSACIISFSISSKSFALDNDGDGLSDVWETHFGAQGLTPTADTDGDGASNLDESIAGTDPFDPKDVLRLKIKISGLDAIATWDSVIGKDYILESGLTDSGSWEEVETAVAPPNYPGFYHTLGTGVFRPDAYLPGPPVAVIPDISKPLVLEIVRRADQSVVERVEFPIRIVDVENMYRHVNLRWVAGGDGGNPSQTDSPSEYPDTLTNGKYFAYIHGYNVTANEARGSQSNIFKRLHQLGSNAQFIGVSWFGDTGNDYHKAVDQGLHTGTQLKPYMNIPVG